MAPVQTHEDEHRATAAAPTYDACAGVPPAAIALSWLLGLVGQGTGAVDAEEELQLPSRDMRNIEKNQRKEAADLARGRAIREGRDGRRCHRKD